MLFGGQFRHYAKEYQHKNVESKDLKRIFEDVTGQNLDWFFNQWVYTAGLPELDIKYKYNRRNEHVKAYYQNKLRILKIHHCFDYLSRY